MPEAMPAGATGEFQELELLDSLIFRLEALINESDSAPLVIASPAQSRRAMYTVPNNPAFDRKPKSGEAVLLNDKSLILHCTKTDLVRQIVIEVAIHANKNGHGENMAMVSGRVVALRRVRGGYDIEIEVAGQRMARITPGQKIRECLRRGDAAGWNRWCQDIADAIDLTGIALENAELAGYDLCCADLTGSDLSGANLAGAILSGADLRQCKLDDATMIGADLFHSSMLRVQAPFLLQSGMVEAESVTFDS
ncbi:MAG: pentapeptide repeat-containing protein [Planctomycetota bacterium]|nr:pentapeptide repeat-containing protein [Planctomycetota bacterium]